MSGPAERRLPPAVLAARRRVEGGPVGAQGRGRAYPAPPGHDDLDGTAAQLAATRALLGASTQQDVADVVATLVRDLDGGLVPARLADDASTLPLDVSFGLTEPMLPWAEPVSVAAMRMTRVLPQFVQDARTVFERLQSEARREEEAELDGLTGLLTRRAWMRRLSSARPEDAVCLVDLDHFKAVNDTSGHAAGDAVLRAVGALLRRVLRPTDACGRYGGDELACLAVGMPARSLGLRMDLLRSHWEHQRPAGAEEVGLSIGVAQVAAQHPRAALESADRALYLSKDGGRDRTTVVGSSHALDERRT